MSRGMVRRPETGVRQNVLERWRQVSDIFPTFSMISVSLRSSLMLIVIAEGIFDN